MRINWKILLQVVVATAAGLGVIYLQRQISGPSGGMVPGLLGFSIAWLVIPAISYDILKLRCWLG
jgi:hypothetical protein